MSKGRPLRGFSRGQVTKEMAPHANGHYSPDVHELEPAPEEHDDWLADAIRSSCEDPTELDPFEELDPT